MSLSATARNVIFSALMFFLVACSLVRAATGTVVTKSGHKYVNAEYKLDRDFQGLLIDSAGRLQLIYFRNVQAIQDAHGRNVWDKSVIASPHSTISLRNGDATNASQKPPKWRMSLRLGPSFNQPAATDYYAGCSSGIGWNGELELPVGRTLSLMLSVSRIGIQVKEPQQWSEFGYTQVRNWVVSGRAMRYSASCMFHQQWLNKRPGLPRWYVSAGIGLINDYLSGTAIGRQYGDTAFQILQLRRGGTHAAISVGAGSVVMITRGIGLDIGGRADQLFGPHNGDGPEGWAYILNLNASLVLVLPVTTEK